MPDRFRRYAALLIAAAGVLAYANTLSGDWVWDDASSVLLHKHVQDPSKVFQLFQEDQHAFGRGAGNFYRPLVSLSFMVDYWLSYRPAADVDPSLPYPAVKPFLFHVTNMAWHIAAALGAFVLLLRLGASRFVAFAVAILFVVHPLHTEAVAYISGRADMLAGAFMMWGLCLAMGKEDGNTARDTYLGIVGATVCFVLALLSKESALIFPVLLAITLLAKPATPAESAMPQARLQRLVLPLVPVVLVLALYLLLRSTVLSFAKPGASVASPLGQRLVETFQSFAMYIRMMFLPTGLHMERTLDGVPPAAAIMGGLLLAALIAVAVISARNGHLRIAAAIAWFLASWLPISGIFPLNAPLAEHWMYVPMIGFWWAFAEALALLFAAPKAAPLRAAVVYALAIVFLVLTVQRNEDWKSNERLFRSTLAQNPNTMRVHYNLAVTYQDLLKNLPGARRHYEAVLALAPPPAADGTPAESALEAHLGLGDVLLAQRQYVRAIDHYRAIAQFAKSGAYRPQVAAAFLGLGKCYLADGDVSAAGAAFGQAVALVPGYAGEAQALLGGKPILR